MSYIFFNSYSYLVYSHSLHISRCQRCPSPHLTRTEYAVLESMLHFASIAHNIALNCCCELSKAQVGFCLNKTVSQKHGKCFCFDYTHTHRHRAHTLIPLTSTYLQSLTVWLRDMWTPTRQLTHTHRTHTYWGRRISVTHKKHLSH